MQPTHLIYCPTSAHFTTAALDNTTSASGHETSTETTNICRNVGIPNTAGIQHRLYVALVSQQVQGVYPSVFFFTTNRANLTFVLIIITFPVIALQQKKNLMANYWNLLELRNPNLCYRIFRFSDVFSHWSRKPLTLYTRASSTDPL